MIRIRETGQVVTESQFRSMHPNTSFPATISAEDLDSLGADPVFEGPQAQPTSPYEYSTYGGVEQINGKWYIKYILGPIFTEFTDQEGVVHTVEEQSKAYKEAKDAEQWALVRNTRNEKLKDSDWTQLGDAPVDTAAWSAYRQALRDITLQTDPFNIVWPETPGG